MTTDTPALRELLRAVLPGLNISSTPRASGQRVVYFCSFDAAEAGQTEPKKRAEWGAVVVKVSDGLDATSTAYLQKEIEILNTLDSVHYPRLFWNDIVHEDPRTGDTLQHRLFVTIEQRIPAQPLTDLMKKFKSEDAICGLIQSIVQAVCPLWLHPQKIVHRDLKPDNILLKEDGTVVIIDLGIVREEGAIGLTLSHQPYGPCTPLYASPEQSRNDKKNINFRSDFFSLGVLAYELVSGSHPFTAGVNSLDGLFERVKNHTPPTLREAHGISAAFSDVVSRMMEKEPYRRQRTVDQLIDELAQARKILSK